MHMVSEIFGRIWYKVLLELLVDIWSTFMTSFLILLAHGFLIFCEEKNVEYGVTLLIYALLLLELSGCCMEPFL